MAVGKLSRFDVNKKVRRALVRNGADMGFIQFSFAGRTVTFTGRLQKDDGREFSASNLDSMLQEIYKIGVHVHSDLDNWSISEGSITKKETSQEKKERKEKEISQRANEASKVGGS
ncbi:MAG: hypothetical protein HN576_05610 [Bacteriovoracaceae bacterium]|jgi:hypothetical protein|nr:hypothetical protein [Bacteriovoracaceae bacterium]